jgi:beta-galactosidase
MTNLTRPSAHRFQQHPLLPLWSRQNHWCWQWRSSFARGGPSRLHNVCNLDSVELFVNGVSAGAQSPKRNSHLYWSVVYAPGVIEARGMKQGKVVLTVWRETTGAPVQLALLPNRTSFQANGEDVVSIAVEVRDAQGRLIPTDLSKVHFSLSGAGKIIGVGNGDPSSREADRPASGTSAERSVFSGQCMVFVQSVKQAGAVELRASSDGLASAVATVHSTADAARPAVV